MFRKKRFRSAIALILTLLLTVALASVAAAQDAAGGTTCRSGGQPVRRRVRRTPPTPDTGTPDPPSPGP